VLKYTHRPHAWGVLGLAAGGYTFSLLTLLFSGAVPEQTLSRRESFGIAAKFDAAAL